MMCHLLRNVWNRRGSYVLLSLELAVCYVLASAVAIAAWYGISNYRRPLGFEYRDVWLVSMDPSGRSLFGMEEQVGREDSVAMQQVFRALQGLDETVAVAEDDPPPFTGSVSSDRVRIAGRDVDYFLCRGGDGLTDVLRPDLVAGRWFDRTDDASAGEPVIINRALARFLFGDDAAVGKSYETQPGRTFVVVGVVADHRYMGPGEPPFQFMFFRARLDRPISMGLPTHFLVRVRPGTPRTFEKTLYPLLRAAAPGWDATIATLEGKRARIVHDELQRQLLYVVVGGSLLLMVALGLVGVLWQSVTQRTQEIGIRRATGATGCQVHLQFTGEMLVLTTAAVLVGVALVLQSAVLELFPTVSVGVYAAGLLTGAAVLYLLVTAAALYPGWLATRLRPAEALHYE